MYYRDSLAEVGLFYQSHNYDLETIKRAALLGAAPEEDEIKKVFAELGFLPFSTSFALKKTWIDWLADYPWCTKCVRLLCYHSGDGLIMKINSRPPVILTDATFTVFARLTLAALEVTRAFENIETTLIMTAAILEEIKAKAESLDEN